MHLPESATAAQPNTADNLESCRENIAPRGRFLRNLGLVLALAALLFVCVAYGWPKFSRAEVFFAECAREMLRNHNFVTPLYHGHPFFDKPILIYWLIIGCFQTFGISHLVARIPSIIGALAAAGITGFVTGMAAGTMSGLLAAMALSSAFMYFAFAACSMSDMLLTMFDVITLFLLYAGAASSRRRTLLWWLASVSMGSAFLTKGPVGLVLPAVSFALYLAITGQLKLIKPIHVLIGGATAAIVASPWFLAAYFANGTGAMQYFFLHENVERFAGSTYDTHRPFWFMVTSFFTGFAPWSIFLPFAFAGSVRKWRHNFGGVEAKRELFLWLWIFIVVSFFSFSRGKIDYYALPAYPAAAVLVGMYLSAWIKSGNRTALFAGWLLCGALAVAGSGCLIILPRIVVGTSFVHWMLMPAALMLASLLGAVCMLHREYFKAHVMVFMGVCLSAAGFALQVLPAIVDMQPVLSYVRVVRESSPDTTIGIYSSLENWIDEILFQTDRESVKVSSRKELLAFLSGKEAVLLIVPEDQIVNLPVEALSNLRIMQSRAYIAHSLNPGFALKRKGMLAAGVPLLLVTKVRE